MKKRADCSGVITFCTDDIYIYIYISFPTAISHSKLVRYISITRRLVRRIYIPLPDADTRRALILHLLSKQQHGQQQYQQQQQQASQGQGSAPAATAPPPQPLPPLLNAKSVDKIVKMTEGYSGSDLTAVRLLLGISCWCWSCLWSCRYFFWKWCCIDFDEHTEKNAIAMHILIICISLITSTPPIYAAGLPGGGAGPDTRTEPCRAAHRQGRGRATPQRAGR